ncbi:hypothetical protein Riv7116_3694 [Rivularia sp. PCC 7116]|uniref:hypothetical protein n=1 Tax=Rivularia sp. PCC 7116 TaxID=373994 RepID=UPI00029EEBED|nr:hypothetical protein [Rivularia sp. PCC 7116]AFY56142.1 hypothetical protein Riv7116_3694 [Rivularia sp. PCC 7116]
MATKINQFDDSNLQSQNSFSSVTNNALPQSPTNNLDISAATYLGGKEDDSTNAVDISLDGKFVIVGGSLKNANLGAEETELLGGGDGTIVRYDSQTNQAVATTRLPGKILDLEVSKNGDIAVAYEGGIAVLNADATEVKWSQSLSRVMRIAISDTGKVGVLQDSQGPDRAYLYDSNGERLKDWSTGKTRRQFADIAVTDQNGGMVITTGYEQKTNILQVAFTQAWSYEGEDVWKNYDFDNKDIYEENLMADTRGQRVAIGRDGQLYSSYYVNGGTGFSIFYRDPFDLSEKVTGDRKIETDKYNSPTNVGSVKMSWYGRYNLENGDLIKGQSLLGRRDDGKGNSVDISSITATEDGTVIIAGSAAGKIANRDKQTIEGQKVSDYVSYDGYIATISPDFQERLSWTPISDSGGGVVASFRNGTTAAVATTNFTGSQITHNAIQDSAGGKNDGYLIVIGGNDVPPGTEPATPTDNPTPVDDTPDTTGGNETPIEGKDILEVSTLESYGGSQDNPKNGTVELSSDNELNIKGNRWQKLEINSTITEKSILRFEFAGNGNGEIQGIGFDNDNVINTQDGKRFFQVDGSQSWGIENLSQFIVGKSGDKDIYEIPVGQFFTGDFEYLTIANDDDQKNPDAEGKFSNIRLFSDTPPTIQTPEETPEETPDSLNISINGQIETEEVLSYGGLGQNTSITSTIKNNSELRLEKNGWKRLDITGYEVTEDTVLKFEFAGNGEAEIQGIGFDNNNAISGNDGDNFFQVDGSQGWGIEDLDDYITGSNNGFTQYSIDVGDFFTGQFDSLTIANDHDVANPTAVGQFQNIELIG